MANDTGGSAALAESTATDTKSEREYGFSALISALGRMWRGTGPALVAILVNAVVQSLLVYWNAAIGMNFAFIISLVLSFLVLVLCAGLLARTALDSVHGKVGLSGAIAGVKAALPSILIWMTFMVVIVTLCALVMPVLAIPLLALLAFVPLAAADGRGNALAANFKALGERWGRWLITAIFVMIISLVLFLLTAVNVLFVKGFPASLITWVVGGIVAWWIFTAWAEIYRSTKVGAANAAGE